MASLEGEKEEGEINKNISSLLNMSSNNYTGLIMEMEEKLKQMEETLVANLSKV